MKENQDVSIKTRLATILGGVLGFIAGKYMGIVPFVPLSIMAITCAILMKSYNPDKNTLKSWKIVSASILIGHAIWILLGNILLLAQGAGLTMITIIGGLNVIIYLTIGTLLVINETPKKSLIAGIIFSMLFTLMNLSSLTSIGNRAYMPLILLHCFYRLSFIVVAVRYMWLYDTRPDGTGEIEVINSENISTT
ncbi:hypothetical protein [Halobacteriovorax sp. YZS-1-1]|uniref:hypothetical protein n=1 Tax=unclassified Halobacteriovorax TaxID=2639665 RepID=UPI00399B7891